MDTIYLRIADLRKKNRLTQQKLADNIGVSFQTISKWETGMSMPDITLLPLLADYFKVSTDQLLGLKPLDGEEYIPERTATKEFWNNKLDYLLQTRQGYWNTDYVHFLVSEVWKIDKPVSVLDCGCGYGYLGMLLLPHLPEGSTYTGIDFAEDLINKGKSLFKAQGMEADFICKNVFGYNAADKYDFVLFSNDVKEWSEYLSGFYGLGKYFKESIVSGNIHMRKPESRIFSYVLGYMGCSPDRCIFIDNSVKNLKTAQNAGINTVLFNRDKEEYTGNIVNDFFELDDFLEKQIYSL